MVMAFSLSFDQQLPVTFLLGKRAYNVLVAASPFQGRAWFEKALASADGAR